MEAPNSERQEARAPRKSKGCGLVFFAFMLVLAGVWGCCLGAFRWLLEDAETTIEAVETFRPKVGSKAYSSDGVLLGEFATEARQLVPLNEIPLHLQKAFVVTEDHRFYHHKGARPLALVSAMKDALRTGRMRGASTMTQQLVRNVDVTGIGKEVTLKRKMDEALAAFQLERRFTKDEILELYLNQIPLGGIARGVEAASWQYFGKSCRDLTLSESAVLAGLTRSPSMNRPDRHPENAWKRRGIVLSQMVRRGAITAEERDAALAESMEESVQVWEQAREEARRATRWRPNRFLAPYFVRHAEGVIERNEWSDDTELREEGLTLVLTVDMRLQTAAEQALREALSAFDERKREELARAGNEDAFVPVSGALVCMDNRPGSEGFVRALVGDRDFLTQQFCNATQAMRQPGSTVKAYIWATAFDNGYTPSDTEMDTPFVRIGWEPKNYGGRFSNGPVTLRNGLERSVNMVAIRLLEELGVPLVESYMQQRLGLTADMESGLALALGTCQVSVLEQCAAYATFANGGLYAPPVLVREISNRDGFSRHKAAPELRRVLPENVAYVLTYVLQGVCESGTAAKATRDLGRPRAGKTGTTNDYRDAWFCGYTPDLTCVVWVGYGDNRPLGRGSPYAGGSLAAPIWTAFMRKAHEGRPVKEFAVPPGVDFFEVDKATGLSGGTFREAFVKGTRPPEEGGSGEEKDANDQKDLNDGLFR